MSGMRYRAATVRESVPSPIFSRILRESDGYSVTEDKAPRSPIVLAK
jgi:hypothetical protein